MNADERLSESVLSSPAGKPETPFSKADLLIGLSLALGVFLFNFVGSGVVEFFRHTEADRSLIGWEMLQRGDFLIPHLLGSVILTKPPLFYWSIAAAISFFGSAAEWVVRFPSVVAASSVIFVHYLFLRTNRLSREFSLLSSVVLATAAFFFFLASVAEIDMIFCLFCTLALYCVAAAVDRTSLPLMLLGYFAAAAAFLTKGPPIVFFFGASMVCYYGYLWRTSQTRPTLRWFLLANLFGVGIFSACVLSWLSLAAARVGWEALHRAYEVEIFERVFVTPLKNEKGPLFYLISLAEGILPWSIFGVLGWLTIWINLRAGRAHGLKSWLERNGDQSRFLVFNLIVVGSALVMLTLSAGKTARYIFPIYAMSANLVAVGLYGINGSNSEVWLRRAARIFGILGTVALIGSLFVVRLDGVPFWELALAVGCFVVVLNVLRWASYRAERKYLILSVVLFAIAYRVSERTVYADFRNQTRSVQPDVRSLQALVPSGATIYTVEMFERWVVYYLKRDGRNVLRLTPDMLENLSGRIYLLLSDHDESWRRAQLRSYDETLKELGHFDTGATHIYLLEVDAAALRYLKLHETIPTIPSEPYYPEAMFFGEPTARP